MIKQTTRYFAVAGALAAGLLLSDPASAQQGGHDGHKPGQHQDARGGRGERGDRGERRLAQLTQRLRLTDQQAAQIRQIFEQERTQLQALRQRDGAAARPQGQPGPRPEGRPDGQRRQPPAEVVALHERTTQQIERVLNESQRAEFRKLREEHEARRREGGERRGPRGEGERREAPAARTR